MILEELSNVPLWVWLVQVILYPVYQVLGTLKHKAGHALAASLDGRGVDRFVFWPQWNLGRFTWGYVRYCYDPMPLPRYVHLMPYVFDALWCTAGVSIIWVIGLATMPPFWRVTALMLAVVLPAIDVAWALCAWLIQGQGDFVQGLMKEES